MIRKIIEILLILIVGQTHKGPKYDLHKRSENSVRRMKLSNWILRHYPIIALIVTVVAGIVFVWTCFMFVGVSAVDSGVTYNHFQEMI